MHNDDMISRQDHEREVSRLSGKIERLNAELSALAAYLITARPGQAWIEMDRAAALAAKVGRLTQPQAAETIRRIHDAVALSAELA